MDGLPTSVKPSTFRLTSITLGQKCIILPKIVVLPCWSRGHMAPAADMKWDSVSMDECFYFTNCCPQDATFNDGK